MDLIACVFEPEDTWSHVKKLIERGEWKSVVIITDKTAEKKIEILHITDNYLREDPRLIKILKQKFEKEI